jgi:OOP family OmpA-OmpF porin
LIDKRFSQREKSGGLMINKAWMLLVALALAAGCATEPPKPEAQPAPPPAPVPAPKPPPPPEPKPRAPEPEKPKPAPEKPKPVAEKVTFAADVLFDFDKAVIKPEGKSKLDDISNKAKGVNLEVVIAIGHADSIGSDAYNQRLSVRRAESVKAYLVSKGIEGNRVYTEGKGEKQPVAENKTAGGRAKNRRVEIEVIGTRKQ